MADSVTDTGDVCGRSLSPAEFAVSRFWRMFPSGMRRRWWLFRPLDLLARLWPVSGPKRGLLVVRMDGIGDMVLFRAALDHYADAFGVAKDDIVVVGCKSWASIVPEVFAGYRVILIDEHAFARRPFYRFKTALRVRRLNAEIAVNDSYLRRALMADSLVWLSAAPRQVVSLPYISEKTRSEYRYYLSQASQVIDTGPYPSHEIERHFRFLSVVAGRDIAPQLPTISWRETRSPLAPAVPYAVLNPGANEPGRRWPLDDYLALAGRLLDRGLAVVFVGLPWRGEDAKRMEEISQRHGVRDLAGKTGLPDLLDLMKHAAVVVANDSGPAHVAIALGTPTVVVVGGGHFGCFVPYPESATPPAARFLYEKMECYHCFWSCHKRTDDKDSFPCVAAVSLDRVWDAAVDAMAGRAAS